MPEGALTRVMRALGSSGSARRRAVMEAAPSEDMGALDRRRIDTARAPFEMANRGKVTPIESVPNISRPRSPRGEALDLNALGDWDLARFEPLERKRPTKVSSRVEEAFKPENVRDFERYVRKGIKEGGLDWYDLSPLSRVALQEMSPEDFRVLMAMNAASSARSSVPDQIKRASLAWYYRKQGVPWPMTSGELSDVADPGYGHLAHEIHSKHLAPLVAGESPNFSSIEQPKYASYHQNFTGNLAPLTADTHYQALHGFPMKETYNRYNKQWVEAPDFSKDVDYPFAEAFSSERARRMGIPPALYQSAAWVGGKEATGVRDARPFAAVYDDILARTAQQMEMSPLEVLKKHLQGKIPLLPISREKAEGGYMRVKMAGGGRLAKNALEQYIRYRLPKEYAGQPMSHLQKLGTGVDDPNNYIGSSRDIWSLGDDKLVKLAKRPRGLYEQSLEGHEGAARNLPRLHWRSPDNELAVVERMPLTPDESTWFMHPMGERVQEAGGRARPRYAMHRDDPVLSGMMDDFGLHDFKKYDVHLADFFLSPEHHWAMRKAPRFKVWEPGKPQPSTRSTPTLLDPGALDYRIANPNFEQQHAGNFRDVVSNRLESMLPRRHVRPEELIANAVRKDDVTLLRPYGLDRGVEKFLGPRAEFPPLNRPEDMPTNDIAQAVKKMMPRIATRNEDQGTFGFADGGAIGARLEALREHFAGGGVVRNWLRGVKGSGIENVLAHHKDRIHRPREQNGVLVDGPTKEEQAMLDWVDKNLGNYLVRQHGTEDDPLRAMGYSSATGYKGVTKIPAAEVPGKLGLLYSHEKIAPGHQAESLRMPPWLERLAEQDKPRHWSNEQYKKARATILEGSNDPDVAAAYGRGEDPNHYMGAKADKLLDSQEKYQRRHAPPVELHDIDQLAFEPLNRELRDTLDYLRQAHRPEDLHRVSVPDALRKSREWHEQMAKKAAESAKAGIAGLPVHKQYPEGWKWVEMGGGDYTHPTRGTLEKDHPEMLAAQAIGKQLGHCYQDPQTCAAYLQRGKLYSLLDPKGNAHATVETGPGSWLSGEMMNKLAGEDAFSKFLDQKNTSAPARHAERVGQSAAGRVSYDRGNMHEWFAANYPDAYKKFEASSISQIRGPQFPPYDNRPRDEALPYVQDFVRSGKWGDVSELDNAGLKQIGDHFMTPEEAVPFRRYKWQRPVEGKSKAEWISEDEYVKRRLEGSGSDTWRMKGDQGIRDFLRRDSYPQGDVSHEIPPDWKPPGMAAGGQVGAADFPRETADERLQRARLALQLLTMELQQEDYSPQQRAALEREIARVLELIQKLEAAGVGVQLGVKDEGVANSITASAPDGDTAPDEGDEQDPSLDLLQRLVSGDGDHDVLQQLLNEELLS